MPPRSAPRDWKLRIDDMLEAATRVLRYLEGKTLEDFGANEMTIDAVARNFEILGEAAGHVPPEIRERHPEIPWTRIRGLRNIVAHGYFDLNLTTVWATARDDLPPLIPLLREILEREP